jgi:hypothetical protein
MSPFQHLLLIFGGAACLVERAGFKDLTVYPIRLGRDVKLLQHTRYLAKRLYSFVNEVVSKESGRAVAAQLRASLDDSFALQGFLEDM